MKRKRMMLEFLESNCYLVENSLTTVGERISTVECGNFKNWSLIYALCDLSHDGLTHCEEPCETEISL